MKLTVPLLVASVLGGAVGLGGYTFVYAKGYSYLTNDPAACANCHIMREHFDAWTRASHRAVAVCNDCHTPPGLVPKYVDESAQRLLALVLLHDRRVSRSDPDYRRGTTTSPSRPAASATPR